MNLEQEICQRDEDYESATFAILQTLPTNLTDAVLRLLNSDEIIWKNIKLHSSIPDCIVVDGISIIAIGQLVPIGEDETILITEENQVGYRQLFGFIYPISLLEHGSVDEISEYMQKIIDIQAQKHSSDDSDSSHLQIGDIFALFKRAEPTATIDESKLTSAQNEALILFNKCNNSGRIH